MSKRLFAASALVLAACGASSPISRRSTTPAEGHTTGAGFVVIGPGRGEPFEARPLEVPAAGDCGGLARLARTRVTMLRDRVSVALPPAEIRGMPHSIMAAEPSRERDELAWIESGEARMAIVASETLRAVEGDLADVVLGWAPATTTIERAGPNLVGVFANPPALRGDDVRLARVYVRDEAGLLVALDVITDPENAERGGCVELAREIAASLTPGARRLETHARTLTFGGLALDVPAGFATTTDEGPDFDVLHVDSIARDLETTGATLGLYAGDHPSFAPGPTPAVTRELLGAPVPFFDQTEEGTHLREALLTHDGLVLHVFYRANDPALFDTVDAIAMSLRPAGR